MVCKKVLRFIFYLPRSREGVLVKGLITYAKIISDLLGLPADTRFKTPRDKPTASRIIKQGEFVITVSSSTSSVAKCHQIATLKANNLELDVFGSQVSSHYSNDDSQSRVRHLR